MYWDWETEPSVMLPAENYTCKVSSLTKKTTVFKTCKDIHFNSSFASLSPLYFKSHQNFFTDTIVVSLNLQAECSRVKKKTCMNFLNCQNAVSRVKWQHWIFISWKTIFRVEMLKLKQLSADEYLSQYIIQITVFSQYRVNDFFHKGWYEIN